VPKPTTFKDYERFFEVFTKEIPKTDGHQYVEKNEIFAEEAQNRQIPLDTIN
jgi:hypothetical protein